MEKEKRMNRIILIVLIVVIVVVIGLVVFINSKAEPITKEEVGLDRMPISIAADDDKNKIGETEEMLDNQDYIENQVVAVAESKREAKKIAKQIGGKLLSYDNQVAVIQIGMTVEEMMQQLEEDSSLPRVYPNYQNYTN
ncbi:MAG: hypothetical protein NC318_14490 [Blautia sp.]|nr:hypothetical protein [Blautia sp.]MCM1213438.1 hypothetical protein [Lachnospiraceae bacterium]